MSTLLRGIHFRLDDLGFAGMATFLALIYGVIALNGGPQDILQGFLAFLFVPSLLFWRARPFASSIALLLLVTMWTLNWLAALPLNLGFTPFLLVIPIVVYSTTRFMESQRVSFIFYIFTLMYCFVSPIMWYQTEMGMRYHGTIQALSWLLIQWLGLTVIRQIAINRRREEKHRIEQQHNRELAALEQQSVIRERERLQIAREIHDVLAHSLTLINVQASAGIILAQQHVSENSPSEEDMLKNIQDTSSSALTEVRGIVKALRSEEDSTILNEVANLASTIEQIDKYRSIGMKITSFLPSDRDLADFSSSTPLIIQLGVHRIVNESFTNIVRHQGPDSQVEVTISLNEANCEIIIDIKSRSSENKNEIPTDLPGSKNGLIGMQERVNSLNGKIQFRSEPRFFHVHASLPFRRGQDSINPQIQSERVTK